MSEHTFIVRITDRRDADKGGNWTVEDIRMALATAFPYTVGKAYGDDSRIDAQVSIAKLTGDMYQCENCGKLVHQEPISVSTHAWVHVGTHLMECDNSTTVESGDATHTRVEVTIPPLTLATPRMTNDPLMAILNMPDDVRDGLNRLG